MIRFTCPVCNASLHVPDSAAGKKGPCPKCGQRLLVPPPQRRKPTQPKGRRNQTILGVTEAEENVIEIDEERASGSDGLLKDWMAEQPPTNQRIHTVREDLDDDDYAPKYDEYEDESPSGLRSDKERHRGFAVGTALGASSVVVDGISLLTLILPCFWFLALPMSGLGAAVGLIGLIASIRDRQRGLVLSIIGMILGLLLLLISGVLVLYAQLRLNQAIERLNRL